MPICSLDPFVYAHDVCMLLIKHNAYINMLIRNTYIHMLIRNAYIHMLIRNAYIHVHIRSLDAFDLKVDLSDIGLESEKDATGKDIITFEK